MISCCGYVFREVLVSGLFGKEWMMATALYDHVRDLAKTLPPQEQLRLVGEIVGGLSAAAEWSEAEQMQSPIATPRMPYPSLWGALKDLGPAPSAEEIDEARSEAWRNFPREDFYK
jgi:hypothetical protein